jgi:hypothetical protein
MERVHPNRVTRRLSLARAPRRLQHAQLGLELGDMPLEGLERLVDLRFVEPAAAAASRQLFDARKRGET